MNCFSGNNLMALRLILIDVLGKSITLIPDSNGCFSLKGSELAPGVYTYQLNDQEISLHSGRVLLE